MAAKKRKRTQKQGIGKRQTPHLAREYLTDMQTFFFAAF